jgi:hypothetical protein
MEGLQHNMADDVIRICSDVLKAGRPDIAPREVIGLHHFSNSIRSTRHDGLVVMEERRQQ